MKPRIGIVTQAPLRLPEVIERVLANDPDLAISRIQLEESGYVIRGAQGVYDPLLGLRGYNTKAVVPVASLIGGTASGKLTKLTISTSHRISAGSALSGGPTR